jgi:hypothetical protein
MTNVLVVSPSVTDTNELEVARNAVASGVRKTGEVLQNYADMLCKYLDLKDVNGNITSKWYERKGKLGAEVKEENTKFKALFPECVKGETPDKTKGEFAYGVGDAYWFEVKKLSGYKTKGMIAKENGVDNAPTSVFDLCKADFKTILNRINKARADKPQGFETLLEIYEETLVVYCTLGGSEDDLS